MFMSVIDVAKDPFTVTAASIMDVINRVDLRSIAFFSARTTFVLTVLAMSAHALPESTAVEVFGAAVLLGISTNLLFKAAEPYLNELTEPYTESIYIPISK